MNTTTFYERFRGASGILFTSTCFDNYFIHLNFLDVNCLKITLSKVLGLGIILGALLVKLPQIFKIVKSKSGEGISLSSVTLDLTAITIYASYSFVNGFPFSAWGDTVFLAIQTLLIGALVLHYQNHSWKALVYVLVYLTIVTILAGGLTPVNVLWNLQACNIPILLSGKLTQAYMNYCNGSTGQLSAATLLMLLAGSLARIFTSIQETGDTMSIVTYMFSAFANAVLVAQLVYYWNVSPDKKKD